MTKSATDVELDGHSIRESNGINVFLNRLLGLPLDKQSALFEAYWVLLGEENHKDTQQAKREGVINLNWNGAMVETSVARREVLHTHPMTGCDTVIFEIGIDSGIPWRIASQIRGSFYRGPSGEILLAVVKEEGEESEPLHCLLTPLGCWKRLGANKFGRYRGPLAAGEVRRAWEEAYSRNAQPGASELSRFRTVRLLTGAIFTAHALLRASLS